MFTIRDTSDYFPALRALSKTPKDMVFGEPVYLHTTAKRYHWGADQAAIIREHIGNNVQDPCLNLDVLLVKLGLDGFEAIQTLEGLKFKDDILLPKLRRKIRDVIEKELQPARGNESNR